MRRSRGLGDVYKRQHLLCAMLNEAQVGQVIETGIDHLLSKHTERVTGAPTVKTCPFT
jgi:hypothetical protein